jgi:pyruvate dehydrogenase E1 component
MRARGFLFGGTAGRTTLAGEGLQHQDGNSHLYAIAYPNVRSYDPAFVYETTVIILDGMRKMYQLGEDAIYYLTIGNEEYEMPAMPSGVEEGIVRGIYKFSSVDAGAKAPKIQLFGSGAILREVIRAQNLLAEKYKVSSTVWSVTSYKELRKDAHACRRWNMLHPDQPPRKSYFENTIRGTTACSSPRRTTCAVCLSNSIPGRRADCSCWARMASAAAKRAGHCAGTSK